MYLEELKNYENFETRDYENDFDNNGLRTIAERYFLKNEKLQTNFVRALTNCYLPERSYYITKVEGYYCIGRIIDDFAPKEIDQIVFPFDENEIYPMQKIKSEIRFCNYYED